MTSIKEMRTFVDEIAEEWLEWHEGDGTQKSEVLYEVKLGPKEWGFEVLIHPGTLWTQAPIYIEFSSGENSMTTLTLPLRDPMRYEEDEDLLTYPEHKEFAADILFALQESSADYKLEIANRSWIQDRLELPEDTYPFALKKELASNDLDEIRREMFEMADSVGYIASNYA